MIQVNLLPWRAQHHRERHVKHVFEALGAVLLALFLLLFLQGLLALQLRTVTTRLQHTQESLARLNQSLEAWRKLYQELDYQKLPTVDWNVIFTQQQQMLLFLKKLAQDLPPEMRVRKLHMDEQGFSLEAVSTVLAQIPVFAEQLKTSLSGVNRWEKKLNIKRDNSLFYYQLRFEGSL